MSNAFKDWTPEMVAAHNKRVADKTQGTVVKAVLREPTKPGDLAAILKTSRKRGMNRTEKRFFEDLKSIGVLATNIHYEAITFKLGPDCRYTPDFAYWEGSQLVIYEVKGGFIRDDSMVKLRVAADKFPQVMFRLAQWKEGKWVVKEITP